MQLTQEFSAPNTDIELEFWKFVGDRQNLYAKRPFYPHQSHLPTEGQEVLRKYRFCNVYRALDKHTYFITQIMQSSQYTEYSQLLQEVIKFRFFNKISSYMALCDHLLVSDVLQSLIEYRRTGNSLFASFYHPKQKVGASIEDNVSDQLLTLIAVLDTVPYLEEVLIAQDSEHWENTFYSVLTNAGCTPRQAYQMMLDLLIPLKRIGGETLSRRTELHGISYASKQAIDALELMGIKGPWKTINRAIRALADVQATKLDGTGFVPLINNLNGEKVRLTVHDMEHSLAQFWKYHHILHGGKGTLYIPYGESK